jgi:hypothetical protein
MEQRQPLRLETNLNGDGDAGVPGSAVEQIPASAAIPAMDTPASTVAGSVMNETVPASPTVAAGDTSVLSPVVATHPQADDPSEAGAGEVQSPTVPTSAILWIWEWDEVTGGVGDDDFARFLEGVDEAKHEGASNNAAVFPGPPSRRPSESDMDILEKLAVVWGGDVSDSALFLTTNLILDPSPDF